MCVHVLMQVIELPVKHPELFESLGIDQPKVSIVHIHVYHVTCM